MFNVWWGILFVVIVFALFLICYRFFGKMGLYAWIGFATVIANLQVMKTIELSIGSAAIIMTLGNTIFTTISMSTDMLNEKYGPSHAKKGIWFGFFTMISSTVIMQMVLAFKPQTTDFMQESMEVVFGVLPLLLVASLIAYLISNFLDVKLYTMLKRVFPKPNQFWIRTNVSTGISQLVDSAIFCSIAFISYFTFTEWLQIVFTTYIFKFLISVVSTPVMYYARSLNPKED